MSTEETPVVCAGFLARSEHNLTIRMAETHRKIDKSQVHVTDELYDSYREMAVANGVDDSDPILIPCRENK